MIAARMRDRTESYLFIAPGILLLGLAFVLPICQMLVWSVIGPDGQFTLQNFTRFLFDSFYLGVLVRTVRLSIVITVICGLIGFPFAYILERAGARLRVWLVILLVLPLMTSVVVRTFGWMTLLGRNGLVTVALRDLGLANRSFSIMHTESAIVIGMVQVLLPFMTLSIVGVINRIDPRLEEAARTMGCGFGKSLQYVVLPLALPGIAAGSLLVFALSASSFVTPQMLGGPEIMLLAASIYQSVTQTLEWPFAAAQAVILVAGVALIMVPYMLLSRQDG
jgi:putative spermidine/putrescine transport system permease protein